MELHQLRYFVQVAKLESLSQAAEVLHVSQPALSKAIAKLEAELGTQLFDRVGKRVYLNDRGRLYLQGVEKSLRVLSEANATVGGRSGETSGSLAVGVFGPQFEALECVTSYMQAHPHVFVTFDARHQTMTSQVTRLFDMVYYPEGPSFDGIAGVPYRRNRLMVCVNREHPLAGMGSVDLIQFKDDPFIFMNTTAGDYERSYRLCLENGFSPRVRAVTSSGAAQMRLIQEGLGVGLVDSMRVNAGRRSTVLLELKGPALDQVQCFACRPVHLLSPTARGLLDHTLGFFGADPAYAAARFEEN